MVFMVKMKLKSKVREGENVVYIKQYLLFSPKDIFFYGI